MFRVVLIGVVLAVGCSAGGSVSDRGQWSDGDPCPDVLFVGLRGSGQNPGMGPQMSEVYERLVAALDPPRDVLVAYHALDYPAEGTLTGGASQYSESIAHGVAALPEAVEMLASQCPETRIVLGGYSQGAHVIAVADHGFLEAWNIDAVVLLANPVFAPDDPTEKVGGFNPDKGGIIRQAWLDGPIAERTLQLCLSGDPVCQFGSVAFWVHSNGYTGEVLDPIARFAADRLEL